MFQKFNEKDRIVRTYDANNQVRILSHHQAPFQSSKKTNQMVAREYLEKYAAELGIKREELEEMGLFVESGWNQKLGSKFRYEQEKKQFDIATVSYNQTFHGLPVWGAGITLQIKSKVKQVVSSTLTNHYKIQLKPPSVKAFKSHAKLTLQELRSILNLNKDKIKVKKLSLTKNRLVIHHYKASERLAIDNHGEDAIFGHTHKFNIPSLSIKIKNNQHYVAHEILFNVHYANHVIPWIIIVDIETNSILHARSFVDHLTGLVFLTDPFTNTGNLGNSPQSSNATLNPLRDTVVLQGLVPPVAGNQSLEGNYIRIAEIENPTIAAPVEASGSNFNYNARTNEFSAVNAYYHNDRFFRLVTDMGFNSSYWGTTIFPLPIDHRGLGNALNAHCVGDGTGGIGHACYALADTSNTTNPIGIAADWRVVLHELGGHGILYCHVNSANFGFAHSAGDSFAAILNDPENQTPDRFLTFPWLTPTRRHDRSVASGWAWGGTQDIGGYASEQILATTLFRIYLSLGGDASTVGRREFAARFTAYLTLRTIGLLTPTHSTQTGSNQITRVQAFVNEMLTADLGDWTSEGLSGGAYGKVIRWAFEKQGLFQSPGASTPVSTVGAPPDVDVFIEDGRTGEYQYQANHWSNTNIWNRIAADGGTTHEDPIVGQINYTYVRVRNRGTQSATNVVVRGFHCNPGAGLVWPNDWQAMTTPQLSAPNIAPNNTQEVIVGPFAWVPSQLGHECLLMIASATGDPSNTDNFVAGDSIPEWRLVPYDNNIGQRNVSPVAAANGGVLVESLRYRKFLVRNPFEKSARIRIEVQYPKSLLRSEAKLIFKNPGGNSFSLKPGQAKEIVLDLANENLDGLKSLEVSEMLHLHVISNDIIIGGMSFELDPNLKKPVGQNNKPNHSTGKIDSEKEEIINRLRGYLTDKGFNTNELKINNLNIDLKLED